MCATLTMTDRPTDHIIYGSPTTTGHDQTHMALDKMAGIDTGSGESRYDYKFVEEPPDSLKCLICLCVVNNPQQHGECGRLFCLSCIRNEHKKRNRRCPHCKERLNTFNDGKSKYNILTLCIA